MGRMFALLSAIRVGVLLCAMGLRSPADRNATAILDQPRKARTGGRVRTAVAICCTYLRLVVIFLQAP
jgi:hypothetical protein